MEPYSVEAFTKVDKERSRLEREKDLAREALIKALEEKSRHAAEESRLSAKLARLDKREAEMIRRGLDNVEELEKLEREEEAATAGPSESSVFDFSEVDLAFAQGESLGFPWSPSLLESMPSDGIAQ